MLRELLIPVAETLFWFTSGELLINTFWIIPWVIFWSFVMLCSMFYDPVIKHGGSTVVAFLLLSLFFPAVIMAVTPPAIQVQLVEQCRTVSAQVTIEGVTEVQDIRQCRSRENFYDTEYGPWKLVR